MKAVILTRVSSKEQEEGHSLLAQNTRLTEYAKKKKLDIINTYQIVESSTRGERKNFTEMLNFCKKQKETIAVIADAVDRVQRSFRDSVLLDELIRKEKIELHFYRENMVIGKNSNAMDIMRWDFAVMGAKSYVLQLSENVKRSIDYKIQNGEYAGQAPVGYINYKNEYNKNWIKPHEPYSQMVAKVFKFYSLGRSSMAETAKEANKLGLKSRNGNKLTPSTIYTMLTNPFYFGYMRYKGQLIKHAYEPLISKELWDKCQDVRLGTARKPFKYSELPFLYRGMITCANTGKICPSEIKKGKFEYVVCYTADGKRKYIPESDVTAQITSILNTIKIPEDLLKEYKEHLKQSKQAEINYRNAEIGVLRAELTKTESRLDKIINMYIDGDIEKSIYEIKKQEIELKKLEIESKIKAHSNADYNFNDLISELIDITKNFANIFNLSTNFELKRNLLKLVFRTLEIKEGNLGYALSFPFNEMQNLCSHTNWLPFLDSVRKNPKELNVFKDQFLLFVSQMEKLPTNL